MSRALKLQGLLLVAAFLLAFIAGSTSAQGNCGIEEEYFTVSCNSACDYDGFWGCILPVEDRCCWAHVEGGCGDGTPDIWSCPECVPDQCGF